MELEIPHEAILKYMERRQVDIQKCREALKDKDLSVIETIGHQLKGNGITFGFPEISAIGEALESAAQQSNNEVVSQKVDELAQIIQKKLPLH